MTRRILLIEDEPISQDIIRSLLTGQGYAVDVVTDGFSALDRARATRYDAALIDYHLPEMDGYALGRLLREQRAGETDAPVLIGLTADRNGLAARRGADAVFRAILSKPIKPSELFDAIERLCGGDALAQPPAEAAGPEAAQSAADRLWREHGLGRRPQAFICPPPAAEQSAALALCFDLVAAEQADLVLLLERHGIGEAKRVAAVQGRRLPIIGLSHDHADICDALFSVDEVASWRGLARLLGAAERPVPAQPRATPAAAVPAPRPAAEAPPDVRNDLRAIILGGISTPLAALRAGIAAAPAMTEHVASLDRALLAAGAVAEFLAAPSQDTAEASVFDPAEMVGNAVAMLRDTAPGRVALAHLVDPSVPRRARGDIHRLSQIVLTLLDDACSLNAGGTLTLRVAFSDLPRSELSLTLTHRPADAGEAAACAWSDPALVARLRALRLATLGRLVTLMDGTLASDAEALFRLRIPVQREAEGQPSVDTAASVLLVDDGATSGQLLTLLLAQSGHRVCRVGDVEAALFTCRGSRHDLLLLDIANGVEARRQALTALRTFQDARTGVPALVLAGTVSPDEAAELAGLGVGEILAKPFAPETLKLAIARARRTSDAEPIDKPVRSALTDALGQVSVGRLTGQLLSEIAALCDGEAGTVDGATAARFVELSSCASVLGLSELALRCAAFEAVGSGAADAHATNLAARAALARTQAAIETRHAA